MKVALVGLALAAAAAGCTAQTSLAMEYVGNEPTIVAASIPALSITKLRGYEDPRHPGKLYVEPTNRFSLTMNGYASQWIAMLPQIEPIYREAALTVLQERGHAGCSIGPHLPIAEQIGIEYEYHCAN